MKNSSRDQNAFILAAGIVLGILALVVWKFSGVINVNFSTGLSVLFRASVVIAICIAIIKFDIFSLGAVIPCLVGGLVWAFFPAFDYWALQSMGGVPVTIEPGESVWYVRWYAKAAFIIVPILGGYGIRHIMLSR
jgi:ascorbate-specific PTS system EIIC-type component UlaA